VACSTTDGLSTDDLRVRPYHHRNCCRLSRNEFDGAHPVKDGEKDLVAQIEASPIECSAVRQGRPEGLCRLVNRPAIGAGSERIARLLRSWAHRRVRRPRRRQASSWEGPPPRRFRDEQRSGPETIKRYAPASRQPAPRRIVTASDSDKNRSATLKRVAQEETPRSPAVRSAKVRSAEPRMGTYLHVGHPAWRGQRSNFVFSKSDDPAHPYLVRSCAFAHGLACGRGMIGAGHASCSLSAVHRIKSVCEEWHSPAASRLSRVARSRKRTGHQAINGCNLGRPPSTGPVRGRGLP
jgi:hypothetical protein